MRPSLSPDWIACNVTLPCAVSAEAEVGTDLVPAIATAARLDHKRCFERVERCAGRHDLAQPDTNRVVLASVGHLPDRAACGAWTKVSVRAGGANVTRVTGVRPR